MARRREIADAIRGWSVARAPAGAIGSVFLVLGILGFVPAATTHDELFAVAGAGPTAQLFGLFAVSVVHAIIHLVLGVAGVVTALVPAPGAARAFLVPGGVVVVLLAAYGAAAVTVTPSANVVPFNGAVNWLHLGLGVGMVCIGVLSSMPMRRGRRN